MRLAIALTAAAGCILAGARAAGRLQERERLLDAWQMALWQMALALTHQPLGLPALLRLGAGDSLPCLSQAAELLEREPALSPAALLGRFSFSALLTRREKRALRDGLMGLFSPQPGMQLQALSCAREQLLLFARASREAAEKNSRLYLSLGCLSGAALFILMC